MSLLVDIYKDLGGFQLNAAFEVNNDTVGLLGASGSGKSMTLKCIAGIEKPDKGRIVLNGVPLFDSEKKINLSPQARGVGYLFQNYALFPHMNVRRNILCGMRKLSKEEQEGRFAEVIGQMQLNGLEKHLPSQLSGGQQQRVALARILGSRPRLLMLDEPFSALDAHLKSQMQVQTQKLLQSFAGDVLMVTHSRTEAYRLCQKIALINNGKLLALKETKALFANPESRQAAQITGCKNIVAAKKVGEHEVEVPAWGIRLTTALPLREGLCAIGIRAHYFNPKSTQNSYPVAFSNEMEEPFEWIVQFRYKGQDANSPDIWWRLSKEKKTEMPAHLGVAPVNVLPLYE